MSAWSAVRMKRIQSKNKGKKEQPKRRKDGDDDDEEGETSMQNQPVVPPPQAPEAEAPAKAKKPKKKCCKEKAKKAKSAEGGDKGRPSSAGGSEKNLTADGKLAAEENLTACVERDIKEAAADDARKKSETGRDKPCPPCPDDKA